MSQRQQFKGRSAFIFAAIGSAVGLGNIWRFPYVAYEGGGGAFIIPYLTALLTAGIPLLFLLYAIGHKYRGSAPLSFRRMSRGTEVIGWWQVGISFVIAVYYAVVIAWAIRYVGFSANQAWGDDTVSFFVDDFLQQSGDFGMGGGWVVAVGVPLIIVWVFTLVVLRAGIQNGIARLSQVFIPLLVAIFILLVIQALRQPGAAEGLNALFTPNWAALKDSSVWVAAYGQIFFSLSIAFGIMITYAAHLKRNTNLTGSGLVVAFANSGFELLAGIGVFSALGFMAQAQGVQVAEVVESGIGLAFFAFPQIVSTMPGGAVFGVLFFVSLVLAGITSLVSIVEVVIDAFEDKFNLNRTASVALIGGLMAVVSILLFPTATGLNLLDVTDHFANSFGIVGAGLTIVILLSWGLRRLRVMSAHLNEVSSFKVGTTWMVLLTVITPLILGFMFISELVDTIQNGYGEPAMPSWYVNTFGWGMSIGLIVIAFILAALPWRRGVVEAEAYELSQKGANR
ncbi:sodium-dependent transporter [Pseudactinotalea sp. HY160]|uniref:sodium-dependent transporter n=1 Tax=Pseudactinotalea sp. HY160 TaxID=2654490 RepID=UPI00128C7088|nr:sodium-dependent transporter [Pseudactinotalea sp. HY160]MPV51383.1 sodium-dependent transporter [Pseudactinotalea sp. HY160]